MKIIKNILFVLIFSFSFFNVFAQQIHFAKVSISVFDCRNDYYKWLDKGDTIVFYKQPENIAVLTYSPKRNVSHLLEIDNIEVARYIIKYKNAFGEYSEQNLVIKDSIINEFKICLDRLSSYPQNTLAKLKNKDSIVVYFHSDGCFHSYSNKITVTKENNKLVARFYNAAWVYSKLKKKETYIYKDGKLLNTIVLNEKQLEDFIRFENELNFVGFGGCTTTSYYTIKNKYLNVDKTDGGCTWDGFRYLQKSFFGE